MVTSSASAAAWSPRARIAAAAASDLAWVRAASVTCAPAAQPGGRKPEPRPPPVTSGAGASRRRRGFL